MHNQGVRDMNPEFDEDEYDEDFDEDGWWYKIQL
jgi:hypothetical protein